ncbi:alpha-galactosidase [Enterococcus gallinarum]|uniref:alpha-galactosidase n=1 Tax=Enterococcus gallinarum TaxID=1353 RepID=UPI0022E45743|nr:alpha-galactosidase [Enterococcus gallinarum]
MISVNPERREFHLKNQNISYIFRVMEELDVLEQLYFGSSIPIYDQYDFLIEREIRPANNQIKQNYTTSLEHIKQEVGLYGTTDFRYPMLRVRYPKGDRISHFTYQHYRIELGKQALSGLPGSFCEAGETLIITLQDRYSPLQVELYYTLFGEESVVTRQMKIINPSETTFELLDCLSFNLDLPNQHYDWLHLDGAWARETQISRNSITYGVQEVASTRGASSHVHNPFMAVCESNATEEQGKIYGFSLIYSGNFVARLQLDTYDILRIQMGINPFEFAWQLTPKSTFLTPEAVLVYSEAGFNGMSQSFHHFFQEHLISPRWSHKQRPVLINNWEATYFDFDSEKLLQIAEKAAAIGVDLFVLDDGWFGTRNSDNGSLGNWQVQLAKIPEGISAFATKINQLGLEFGLWFEPEMISTDTPLYEMHPEWVIGNSEKQISHGRNQFVLDFSNPEVVETIFQQIDCVLACGKITYLKWDMNRYISEPFSNYLADGNQGELFHRYILGVYDLYEKILAKYPDLLIESCAGGGGRFDPGLLYYAPQTWASDDTDGVERLKIQYGASMVYPLASIGSHLSQIPNHQVGRSPGLTFRNQVAMFGTYGLELDITRMSDVELQQVKAAIATFKEYRELIHEGRFYRLNSPFDNTQCSWMVVSKDLSEALVADYQVLGKPNPAYRRLLLAGLDLEANYQINQLPQLRSGKDLSSIGLIMGGNYVGRAKDYWSRQLPGDYASQLYHLRRVDK